MRACAGSNIKYGPYKDTPPFAASPMRLHFPNNNPFAEAEVLEREVEVSHWGNVAVDEQYSIRHVGAKQKVGSFLAQLLASSAQQSCNFESLKINRGGGLALGQCGCGRAVLQPPCGRQAEGEKLPGSAAGKPCFLAQGLCNLKIGGGGLALGHVAVDERYSICHLGAKQKVCYSCRLAH